MPKISEGSMIHYIITVCLFGSVLGAPLPSYLLDHYVQPNTSLYNVIQQKFQALEERQVCVPFQTFILSEDHTEFLAETLVTLTPEQIIHLNSLVLYFSIAYNLDPNQAKPLDLFISAKTLEILLQLEEPMASTILQHDVREIVEAMYTADYLMINLSIFSPLLSKLSDRQLCILYYSFAQLEKSEISWIQKKIYTTVENAVYNRLECKVIATLEEHTGVVTSVAISHDNSYIVSASRDKTIKIWRMQNEQVTYDTTLIGHRSDVTSVAISADNAWIVSGSCDKTVNLWDRTSGNLLHTFKGHRSTVASVCISPDCRKIISSSWDKTIRIWDVHSKNLVYVLSGHTGMIHSLAISPDGNFIISAATDNTIKIWDLSNGTLINTLENPMYYINSGAIATDGQYLIARSKTDEVAIWKVLTGELCQPLGQGKDSPIKAIAMSLKEDCIVSANDKTLTIWNLVNKTLFHSLDDHKKAISAVTISPDGHYIVSASEDKIILVWRNNISVDNFCKKHLPELFA